LALSVTRLLRSGSSSFAGHPLGNYLIMDRTELLARMLGATSPNETSTGVYDARRWLVDHPDDQTVRSAMADLIGVERLSLSPA
jgi:hypothetical protein